MFIPAKSSFSWIPQLIMSTKTAGKPQIASSKQAFSSMYDDYWGSGAQNILKLSIVEERACNIAIISMI